VRREVQVAEGEAGPSRLNDVAYRMANTPLP
jgi:hypothetical protein